MADTATEASYRVNDAFGEAWYVPRRGTPILLAEVQVCTFTKEIEVMDVPLSGNRTGSKDGAEQPGTGTMTVQVIDSLFDNIVEAAFSQNLAARRRARNLGQRIPRTFQLDLWTDDPEALGVFGDRLFGVRLSRREGGFDRGSRLKTKDYPFRYERSEQISAFERIGNQIHPDTGLPLIRYTAGTAPTG